MSRHLSAEEAEQLKPGADHYRAFVGPPKRYGLMTLYQMGLLAALGLEETDGVLDFGCGSIRLGRSLIPFLRPGGYFGIDPYTWLIEDGLKAETGEEIMTVKSPRFSDEADFDCTVFDERFDFIIAQSIVTHAGAPSAEKLFASTAKALKDDGVFLFSYLKGADDIEPPAEPWTYPHNVAYPEPWLKALCERHGLIWRALDWHHPGACWVAAALDERRLPPEHAPLGLAGKPLERWRA
ncbi:MAG: methyltransferase domain-containing protein [Pseudomonadota bacterium]